MNHGGYLEHALELSQEANYRIFGRYPQPLVHATTCCGIVLSVTLTQKRDKKDPEGEPSGPGVPLPLAQEADWRKLGADLGSSPLQRKGPGLGERPRAEYEIL